MDLVDMERMGFEGMVFDGPVFHGSHVSRDRRLLIGFENLLLLSVHRDVELNRSVGPAKFLREVEFPLRGWLLFFQARELNPSHGPRRRGYAILLRLRFVCAVADLNLTQFLLQIGVASWTGGISQRNENRLVVPRRSLHDKLRPPRRWHQNGVLEPRFRQRI